MRTLQRRVAVILLWSLSLFLVVAITLNSPKRFGSSLNRFGILQEELPKQRRNIMSPFDNNTDVLLLPSLRSSYLCEYLTDATQLPSGCVLSCGAGGQHDGGDFNCHVHT
ncbi:hypothetical protein DQ04_20011010, partial [Trypanosoma grayi]|uniref:hypothetical protein n=1 Tax=Trypanosoma grayi TaxID=71804 RepID=UPI0004F448A2